MTNKSKFIPLICVLNPPRMSIVLPPGFSIRPKDCSYCSLKVKKSMASSLLQWMIKSSPNYFCSCPWILMAYLFGAIGLTYSVVFW